MTVRRSALAAALMMTMVTMTPLLRVFAQGGGDDVVIREGARLFTRVWTVAEGLGPTFNARGCSGCHTTPDIGGSGTEKRAFVLITPVMPVGSRVVRRLRVDGMGAVSEEALPRDGVVRKTPSLFGSGLLEAVPDNEIGGSSSEGSASVGFTYDTADRRTVLTLPNGVTVESTYGAASQVTALTYKLGVNTLGDLTYTYDAAGNRTAVGGSWARTTLPAALASATYNAGNQIATWGATSFTYDLNGNLTNDGSKTYAWNARNELTGLSGGASASFAYDGVGRRRAKTISGSTTGFLYDGSNAVQELTSGSPSANILAGLGLDEWFRRTDSTTTRDFLTDVLGSTVALGDTSGAVQTEYTYAAFGATTTSGSSTTNRSGFTGREDDGTGLNYYRARYQHPTLQRFISEDPIQFEGGSANLHAYVFDAPTHWTDPLGLAVMLPPRGCNPRKHPIAWLLRCNPLALGAGPVLGAASAAGAGLGWGGGGAAGAATGTGASAGAGEGDKISRAAKAIADWLGPNARAVRNAANDLIAVSRDGSKRVRFDINNPAPHSSPHSHVEVLVNGKWVKSGPIYPPGVVPK